MEGYILVRIHQLQRTRSQEPAEQCEFRLKSLVNWMFHDFARRIFYSKALFELCFDNSRYAPENTWGWCPNDLRACLLLCSQLLCRIFFRKAELLRDWWWPFRHCASPPICSAWQVTKISNSMKTPPHKTHTSHVLCPHTTKIRQRLLYFFFPSKIKRVLSWRQTKPTSSTIINTDRLTSPVVGAKKLHLNTTAKTAADAHLAR